MRLPDTWVNRIVVDLQGAYGQQFIGKFSKIENGVDIGIANFKEQVATRLAGFFEHPEAIRYMLDTLPSSHCPNAIELRELAQRAPRKHEAPALTHTPTPEEIERGKHMASKAAAELKPKFDGGIDRHWATHPLSEMHFRFILDAAKKDSRFRPCVAEMVEQGICTADFHLLKKYAGVGEWVKP